jgi:beta-lactamase regulating signal transducer with metallopeptidase domain/uncharacterized GH25 family protein
MTLLTFAILSWPTLLFLANVAIASLIVSASTLVVARYVPRNNQALRHAVLVGGLVVPLVTPLTFWIMGERGLAMIRLRSGNDVVGKTRELNLPQLPPIAPVKHRAGSPRALDEFASPNAVQERTIVAPQQGVVTNAPAIDRRRPWIELAQLAGTGLAIIWAAGCAVALWILSLGIWQLRRLLKHISPLADPSLQQAMRQAAEGLRLWRLPELCASEFISAPLSVGVIRHRIVLPTGTAQSLSARQLQTLLRHELAHIVRGDHLVGLLQRAARIAYWWSPLAHRVSTEISFVREQICDDWATGVAAADEYAQMLVDLAARVVRAAPLPTAIGIFESPAHEFSQRIQRLLEPGRSVSTAIDRRTRILGAGIFVALLSLGAIAPIRIQTAAAETPPAIMQASASGAEHTSTEKSETAPRDASIGSGEVAAEPIQWPSVLRGTIKDTDGKPIAGARVRFDFEKIHEYNIGRWDENLGSQSMVTSENGEYRFDSSQFPELTHRPFCLTLNCTANGYSDTKWWNWYNRDDVKVGEMLANVKMLPGRLIRGRCVDREGNPLPGTIVKMASDFDFKSQGPSSWAWDPRETDDDGQFQFSIPRDTDNSFEVWAVHPRWAPQRVAVPKSGDVLADIRLQNGVPIHGTVFNADGTPIAGAVVVAESVDDGTLKSVAFAAQVATRTDAKGRYNLQPLAGLYKVFLTQAEKTDNRLEHRFVVADEPPPLVVPVRLVLSGHETQTLDFHAGPTLSVRGAIHWPDGRPVPNCKIQASYMPPGNGTGIWLAQTFTGADGNYSLSLPKPISDISISTFGAFDDQHKWVTAVPNAKVRSDSKYEQHVGFKKLDDSVDGIDWLLSLPEPAAETVPAPKGAGEIELEKLGRRYAALEQKRRDAMETAKTPAEKFEAFKSFDPRIQLADAYLALEEKYRGSKAGLCALIKLGQFACSVSDAVPKVPEARWELVDRLLEHYLADPNLDLALGGFNAGPNIERAPELLRRAAAESPHRNVQAAALYYNALYLRDRADAAAQVDDMLIELEHAAQPNQAWIDMVKRLKGSDPAAERTEAIELCDRLIRDYADVDEPYRVFEGSGIFREGTPDANSPGPNRNFKSRAEGLLFDLEHLQVGMRAPELAAVGDNSSVPHTSYKLRDGKVTVVAFLSYGQDALESELRNIAAGHADGLVDVVTVFNDMGVKPTGTTTENPTRINVSSNGPIPWAVDSWPCIFVVDQQGIIRGRRLTTAPSTLVNQLLAKSDRDGK